MQILSILFFFSQMQNIGLKPSCGTYDGFIRALVSVKGFQDGMAVVRYGL